MVRREGRETDRGSGRVEICCIGRTDILPAERPDFADFPPAIRIRHATHACSGELAEVTDGEVDAFQVTLKVGFRLED